MEWILGIIGLFILFGIISWIRDAFADAKLYRTLKPQLDALESEKEKFAKEKNLEISNSALNFLQLNYKGLKP